MNQKFTEALDSFIKSKDNIDTSFEMIDAKGNTCLNSTSEAAKVSKQQQTTVENLVKRADELIQMAQSLVESTQQFEKN